MPTPKYLFGTDGAKTFLIPYCSLGASDTTQGLVTIAPTMQDPEGVPTAIMVYELIEELREEIATLKSQIEELTSTK